METKTASLFVWVSFFFLLFFNPVFANRSINVLLAAGDDRRYVERNDLAVIPLGRLRHYCCVLLAADVLLLLQEARAAATSWSQQ